MRAEASGCITWSPTPTSPVLLAPPGRTNADPTTKRRPRVQLPPAAMAPGGQLRERRTRLKTTGAGAARRSVELASLPWAGARQPLRGISAWPPRQETAKPPC
ncbi:hypothetical protein ACPA9J_14415 [Pseudomonas aeruginosa]